MAAVRRGPAAHRRAHLPVEDPQAPGCCATCRLPLGKTKNALHLDELPAVDPDITAAEHRRIAEKD